MYIREIKNLPEGRAVECGGTIDQAKSTRQFNGQWVQNVRINDGSGGIWIKLNHGDKNRPLNNGTAVEVKEAVVDGFDVQGKRIKSLDVTSFVIPARSEPPAGSPYEYRPENNRTAPDWDAIAAGKVRSLFVEARLQRMSATELAVDESELNAILTLTAFAISGKLPQENIPI